jgi:hypothetical protein
MENIDVIINLCYIALEKLILPFQPQFNSKVKENSTKLKKKMSVKSIINCINKE